MPSVNSRLTSCAALLCRALRRVNRLCSRTVSGTAYRLKKHGRRNPLPFPFSQRSHVGNLRQTIQGKGVIHKRVETAGVYPLVRPRGVSATPRRGARRIPALRRAQLPAESQRKAPRPERTNTLTQFAHPAQPVQKKSRPVRDEHACGSSCPPQNRCKEKNAEETLCVSH